MALVEVGQHSLGFYTLTVTTQTIHFPTNETQRLHRGRYTSTISLICFPVLTCKIKGYSSNNTRDIELPVYEQMRKESKSRLLCFAYLHQAWLQCLKAIARLLDDLHSHPNVWLDNLVLDSSRRLKLMPRIRGSGLRLCGGFAD